MEGHIEIFQGSPCKENLIFSEKNLIVDGAGMHVVDILTNLNSPSSLTHKVQASSVKDFGIKAITLGSAQGATAYNRYSVSADSGPSALTPIPPQPTDTTIQPATTGPGKEGHFLNYYNFSSTTGLTLEEVRKHGCYLPSAGIYFDGSTFGYTHDGSVANDMSGVKTGHLNTVGAINSDGYIFESSATRGSQTLADASGGFIVSGNRLEVSGTRMVKYILTITYEDWKFLDYYYGGIGAIGLWTLDREATLAKYNNESETAEIDLYKVADTTRNPVFKLFAKKVFLPGGLKLNEATVYDDYITITWGLKF